jgi:hypothetical protein
MLSMPTPSAVRRLVLVSSPAHATDGRDSASVRRYRIARLRVEGRAHADDVRGPGRPGAARHAHLKRSYD